MRSRIIGGLQRLRQRLIWPLSFALARGEAEPADAAVDKTLMVLHQIHLAKRDRLIAHRAQEVAAFVGCLVDEHGASAEGAKVVEDLGILRSEVGDGRIAGLEHRHCGVVEPQFRGAVLHHVFVVGLKLVPDHIARRNQAVADRGEARERHHAGAVDLPFGLLLARPIIIAIHEGVAIVRGDQLRDFFPLGRGRIAPGLKLREVVHDALDQIGLAGSGDRYLAGDVIARRSHLAGPLRTEERRDCRADAGGVWIKGARLVGGLRHLFLLGLLVKLALKLRLQLVAQPQRL